MGAAPLFVIINNGSGAKAADTHTKIVNSLRASGREVTLHEIPHGIAPRDSCQEIVKRAVERAGIIVAAGGDGTVNALAALCYEHGLTLGIIPLGTFNYVARALHIPLKLEEALEVLVTGTVRTISAGFVQEHLFLNNASFGLYPTLIRRREQASKRYGRKRIIAALSALHSLLSKQKLYSITFNAEERSGSHRTSMVFVGNNTLQLENLGLEVSDCTKMNKLAVVILRRVNRLELCRLIWRGIMNNLKFESKLLQFCADIFEVETNRKEMEIVVDGEIVQCKAPLNFRVVANAIKVLVPPMQKQTA
jgi:diacylglycerol kinase family enzyme